MPSYTEYLPALNSPANAVTLMRYGAVAAGLNALLAAGIGIAAIGLAHPVMGMDAWILVDAAVFAVITWRVYCQSLPWAIMGLALFALEELFKLASHPSFMGMVSAIGGAVVWGPCYVYAVRGGLYLREKKLVSEGATGVGAREARVKAPRAKEAPAKKAPAKEARSSRGPAPAPKATQDDYNEFLAYLRQKGRRYQRAGRSVQDEFAVWRAHHPRKHQQEEQKQEVGVGSWEKKERTKETGTKGQRDKGTKGRRDEGTRTKGQRDKGTKGQRDKGTKGQRKRAGVISGACA